MVIGYCNKEGDDQASYEIRRGVPSLELGYFHMEFGEGTKVKLHDQSDDVMMVMIRWLLVNYWLVQ